MQKLTGLIKEVAATLGNQYTLILIDDSWCIYRDLGNGYDIEINMSKTRKYPLNVTVYVWQIRDKLRVIEKIDEIREIEDLKYVLAGIVTKTNKLATNRNKVYKPILQTF
ncbi:MAG: hypothetical protein E7231_09515 [Cellulosilyticum sp.]|nr:hypothetical protein [Cellulosilyticum sp.]